MKSIEFFQSHSKPKHDHPLPLAIFQPFSFSQMQIKKMKSFFFKKKHFFHCFQTFPISKFFQRFCKEFSQLCWKGLFSEVMSFDRHSTAKLPPLTVLSYNNFFEKLLKCQEKTYFVRLKNHTISVAFYAKSGEKVIENFKLRTWALPGQQSSKH